MSISDVEASSGARSVTDVDYRRCAPVTTALGWRCDLPFPWQTAAVTGPALATLGVRDARVARLVTTDRAITETILNVDAGGDAAHVVQAFRRACPASEREKNGAWTALGQRTAVLATGPVLVAVDFTEGTWTNAAREGVLRAAANALGRN